jgi:hypothetical protein
VSPLRKERPWPVRVRSAARLRHADRGSFPVALASPRGEREEASS